MKGDWNKHDVEIGDMFLLSYCGLNVFFRVGATDVDGVYIYEVGTREIVIDGKHADVLAAQMRPALDPLVVLKKYNSWTKADYFVKTGTDENGLFLSVYVSYGSKLFLTAQNEYGINYPDFGEIKAYWLDFAEKNPYQYYWEKIEPKLPEA